MLILFHLIRRGILAFMLYGGCTVIQCFATFLDCDVCHFAFLCHFAFADNGEGAPLGANRRVGPPEVLPTSLCEVNT